MSNFVFQGGVISADQNETGTMQQVSSVMVRSTRNTHFHKSCANLYTKSQRDKRRNSGKIKSTNFQYILLSTSLHVECVKLRDIVIFPN